MPPTTLADHPLTDAQPYPGPEACFDADTGTVWIGRYADGTLAPWQLYRPGWGACGGVVVGGTGSGGSMLLDTLGHTAAHTGLVSVWAADPGSGLSLPGATRYAHWHGNDDTEIGEMLWAAWQAATARLAANARHRRELHPITPASPMVLVLIDQCDRVFTPGVAATRLAASIARSTRQTAVAIAVTAPYPGVRSFGNDDGLRAALLAGNAATLRTMAAGVRLTLPGLVLDPATLPPLPGIGAVVGGRPEPFRGWYRSYTDRAESPRAPQLSVEPAVADLLGDCRAGRPAGGQGTPR